MIGLASFACCLLGLVALCHAWMRGLDNVTPGPQLELMVARARYRRRARLDHRTGAWR